MAKPMTRTKMRKTAARKVGKRGGTRTGKTKGGAPAISFKEMAKAGGVSSSRDS